MSESASFKVNIEARSPITFLHFMLCSITDHQQAYRLEPLVNPSASHVKPVLMPHHKGRKRLHLGIESNSIVDALVLNN